MRDKKVKQKYMFKERKAIQHKSGVPVDEKYAGVSVSGELLEVVPIVLAYRLKKLNYDSSTSYYYNENGELCQSVNGKRNFNTDASCVSAPYLYEVKEWLKRFGIQVNTTNRAIKRDTADGRFEFVPSNEWYRVVYINDVQYKRPINSFLTESDALAIAIREGVNYLLKDKTSPFAQNERA